MHARYTSKKLNRDKFNNDQTKRNSLVCNGSDTLIKKIFFYLFHRYFRSSGDLMKQSKRFMTLVKRFNFVYCNTIKSQRWKFVN